MIFQPGDKVVFASKLLSDISGRVIGTAGRRILVVWRFPVGIEGPPVMYMDPKDLRIAPSLTFRERRSA